MVKKKVKTILLTIIVLSLISININSESVEFITENNENNDLLDINILSESPIQSNIDDYDQLSGLGDILTCDEDAQYTNSSQSISSLNNNSFDYTYIETPQEWTGYELLTEVSGLSDNTTWEMNGNIDSADDWTYDEIDFDESDPPENCDGYYENAAATPSGTETGSLYVKIDYNGPGDWLDTTEYAAFNQTIDFDRGLVSYCRLDFSYYNGGIDRGIATGFVSINGYKVNFDAFGDTGWKDEKIVIPTSELPDLFDGVDNVNITLGIDVLLTAVWNGGSNFGQELNFDNISLWIRAEANPSQLNLTINGTSIDDDGYGLGNVSLSGDWPNPSTSSTKTVIANFTTNSTDVNFDADLTLFVNKTKNTQDSNGDPYSEFFVNSGQEVNWTSYFYGAKPALYEDYNYTMYFPSDWSVWSAIDPNPIEVINYLTENPSSLVVPSDRANNYPGTWKISFNSPNYVESVSLYKNTTGTPGPTDWFGTSEIYAGDYLNVTGTIKNDGLISDLVDTKATLTIKFPNGTVWDEQTQTKTISSNSNGKVFFDAIQIPSSGPNYVAGDYKIFVDWNNTYSTYGINETGMLMKTLITKHLSKMTMSKIYYADLLEDTSVGVTVEYNDLINNDPIEDASLYFTNLTGQIQDMTEIAPGYYFAEIYNPPAYKGDNIIIIYANSSNYQNLTQEIIVEVVLGTELEADEYPTFTIPWNENVTIHLNYTEIVTENAITNANFTNDWSGENWINETDSGLYELHLNTSIYSSNQIYCINISTADIGFNPVEILIDIKINNRNSNYNLYLNEFNKTDSRLLELPIYTLLNISFDYLDVSNKSTISTDSIILKDFGSGDINLDLLNNIYQCEFDTNELGVGIHELTINATSEFNYPIILSFTVIVQNRTTEYELSLNEEDKTSTKSIEVPMYSFLNVSVNYLDQNSSFVDGATVTIISLGLEDIPLLFSNSKYQSKFDISDLGVGIHELTVVAWADKFELQTFVIILTVQEVESGIDMYIDSEDLTLINSVEAPIRTILNISIDYFDYGSRNTITTASCILTGGDLGILPMNFLNGYFQIQLNTSDLGLGVYFITITADHNNYKLNSTTLTITVVQIPTTIQTEDSKDILTIEPDETFILGFYLNDDISDSLIFGANVSYSSIFGEGLLTDEDGDGYYTAEISGLETGLYIIYISVNKGEDYAFEEFELTLNVVAPNQPGGISPAVAGSMSGIIILIIGAMMSYLLYFKYPKRIRDFHKIKKNLKKQKPLTTSLKTQEDLYNFRATAEIMNIYPKYKQIRNQKIAELAKPVELAVDSEKRQIPKDIKSQIEKPSINESEIKSEEIIKEKTTEKSSSEKKNKVNKSKKKVEDKSKKKSKDKSKDKPKKHTDNSNGGVKNE